MSILPEKDREPGARRARGRAGTGPAPGSTPGSAGSPGRRGARRQGAASQLPAALRRARGEVRHAAAWRSTGSVSGWSPRRSSPTPPSRCKRSTCPRCTAGTSSRCQLFSEPGAGSDLAAVQATSDARRRRMDRHGPEGLDLGRASVRHRRDRVQDRPRPAQAQGHHRLRRGHARTRGGDAAAPPDDGRGFVQRGLLHTR